jgi:hypothetical protein
VECLREEVLSVTETATPRVISKDDLSDLKSHHDRCIQTALELERAEQADFSAKQELENWMWRMEHGK